VKSPFKQAIEMLKMKEEKANQISTDQSRREDSSTMH
jgi:hypothetical protein